MTPNERRHLRRVLCWPLVGLLWLCTVALEALDPICDDPNGD